MIFTKNLSISASSPDEMKAAKILKDELISRLKIDVAITKNSSDINFVTKPFESKDIYEIAKRGECLDFSAFGIRGFIYCIGRLLRKSEIQDNKIIIPDDLCGKFAPDMKIRGHQLGYRTTPNTYDAWDYEQYRRYYLDLMFFGMNTVEHIPYQSGKSKRNSLMKYDEEEFLVKGCEIADEFDLDVSLWHPNYDNETDESAAKRRGELYSKIKRLDYVFIPGGDPGNLPADVFMSRCKAISKALKKSHPAAGLWPSVQAPHEYDNWGEVFTNEIQKLPDEIDGVIYGPNHAFPLDEVRKRIPDKYPLRFYPDITHNVRCEYPVHYDKQDWHFAFCNNLSRECTNPRPFEYAFLHKETRGYFIGSVSYSEGITDDVNKCIWSSLDFDFGSEVTGILEDYCRLYFPGQNSKEISNLIISLEKNWDSVPEENDKIDITYNQFNSLYKSNENLRENWRFVQLYLRSVCDKYIRDKRINDLSAITLAKNSSKEKAIEILESDYPSEIKALYDDIEMLCDKMFKLIGYQSSVEKYDADGWERGAILDTINLPVSDRKFLINVLKTCSAEQIKKAFEREKTDGIYYCVSVDGPALGRQKGEVYMNFQGDRPDTNDGTLPAAQFNVYDNYSFEYEFGELEISDYILRITWLSDKNDNSALTIKLNGNIIYEGKQFGEIDEEYSFLNHKKFVTAKYKVDSSFVSKNKNLLEMHESSMGVMFAEIRFDKI